MSDQNPFAVGEYADAGFGSGPADPNVPAQTIELIKLLSQTRPWVRLFSILMLLGGLLMIAVGFFAVLGAAMGGGGAGPAETGILGAIYFPMAFLYIYPAWRLSRYASAISTAEKSMDMTHIIEAISQQKSFWKFCGIAVAIVLIVYLLAFIAIATIGVGFGLGL